MRFSVVVPLYNKGPHVAATIASALEQTFSPYEIIVVDDGSSDDGLEQVRSLNHPQIRIFERPTPGPGGYAARNLGIQEALGDWIAFLDADDIWRPGHLAGLKGAIEAAGEGVGCAFAKPVFVSGEGVKPYPLSERYLVPGKAHDWTVMLRAWLDVAYCPMWTSATAFRRELLIKAGLFPAGRTRRGGDKDLWLRCMWHADSAYSVEPTAEFHQDTVNRVSNTTPHFELPVIVETIRALLGSASPEAARLLRALSNQEIGLYARYATGARGRFDNNFFSSLYQPEGLATFFRMLLLRAIGLPLRIVDPKRRLI